MLFARRSLTEWFKRYSATGNCKRRAKAGPWDTSAICCAEALERRFLLSAAPATLYSFTSGVLPTGIAVDDRGNVFGTTFYGGADGDGSIWELARGSSVPTTLYSFTGGADGEHPRGIAVDENDNLYGVTAAGGADGLGTFFELANGTQTVTATSFTSETDASDMIYHDGNRYFTADEDGADGDGSIWLMNGDSNTPSLVYSWTVPAAPAGLTIDGSGNIYTVVQDGGTEGLGAIEELVRGANTITTLFNFTGGTDGNTPIGIVVDSSGNLFGTTEYGGVDGDGAVWELPHGASTITILYSFTESTTDGGSPREIALDSRGDIYVATTAGGADADGTIFELPGVAAVSPLALITPATATSIDVGQSYTLDWTGGNSADTVQIWVEGGPNNSWTELTAGVPDSNGAYTWNTTGVDHGWYYFQAWDISSTGATYAVQSPNWLHVVDPSASAPNVSLTNPPLSTSSIAQGGSFTLNFTATDGSGDANPIFVQLWVYSGNTGQWTELPNASYLPGTQGSYVWNTAGVAPGWYSFAADATNGDQWSSASSPGWLNVTVPTPTFTFTTPTSGQTAAAGGAFALDWSIAGLSSTDLSNATVQIWAQYLDNGSPVWTEIAASVTASNGTYTWTVPTSPGNGTYYAFRVWLNYGNQWWAQSSPNWLQVT